jgi:hypothetical protein
MTDGVSIVHVYRNTMLSKVTSAVKEAGLAAIASVYAARTAHTIPTLQSRMAERTSDFQLISVRPFVETGGGINMKKPFTFPVEVKSVDEVCVDSPVYFKDTISCADDIVVCALKSKQHMEIKAHGFELTVPDAIMEASRYADAELCKYIVFEHPIHKRNMKKSSVVLENTAAPVDSNKVMVVSLAWATCS